MVLFSDWQDDLRTLQGTVDRNMTPSANLINVDQADVLACFSRAVMRKKFNLETKH